MMLTPILLSLTAIPQGPHGNDSLFHPPQRLQAGGSAIRVEAPGYAAPCRFDANGDGIQDLIVGQFAGGKLRVYPGNKDGSYGEGDWLMAEGDVAEVPGVW